MTGTRRRDGGGFTEKRGIEVEVDNATSESVLQRVLQEQAAGDARNDVLINTSPDMRVAENGGLLGTYSSEYCDAVSDGSRGEQWTAVRRLAFVAGWNTKALKGEHVPDEFSGFADTSWKGRISLELSDFDWNATLRDHYVDEGMSRLKVKGAPVTYGAGEVEVVEPVVVRDGAGG